MLPDSMQAQNVDGRVGLALVLGDVTRSPRMRMHAHCMAQCLTHGAILLGTRCARHRRCGGCDAGAASVVTIPTFDALSRSLILLPLRALLLTLAVFLRVACLIRCPSMVVVQAPPSAPALVAVHLALSLRICRSRSRVVCDWHNLGSTLLWLKLQSVVAHVACRNALLHSIMRSLAAFPVSMYKAAEFGSARVCADAHFAVSDALAAEICRAGLHNVTVVRDRAPDELQQRSLSQRSALFRHIASDLQKSKAYVQSDFASLQAESLASLMQKRFSEAPDAPALLVSATSWTADEDMHMLLEALHLYSSISQSSSETLSLPRILTIITGDGPMRDDFEHSARIKLHGQSVVAVRTAFLPWQEYAQLIGSADVGVSMHVSSSGLDLPMKAVDMLGCGVPVLSVSYSCINELIYNGTNGLTFTSASELADCLVSTLDKNKGCIQELRKGAQANAQLRWHSEWASKAWPVLNM